jgi:hypothetical protein
MEETDDVIFRYLLRGLSQSLMQDPNVQELIREWEDKGEARAKPGAKSRAKRRVGSKRPVRCS